MLTRTGATCLKLCRAKSLDVLYLAILCDLFVIVQWPFSRSSDLQLEDSKATLYPLVYLNHICVCFRAWLLAVCVLVKEPRKPKSGRPLILRNNSLLGREICRKWALCRLISNTEKQSMFVVLGWFRTRPKLWKHRWPKYLRLLANGILKTVLHHADCPNANLAASPLLCVREDFGSQWKQSCAHEICVPAAGMPPAEHENTKTRKRENAKHRNGKKRKRENAKTAKTRKRRKHNPFRSTLNTNVITALGMRKVCTPAVHSVYLEHKLYHSFGHV